MAEKRYEVEVVYRQSVRYVVAAEDDEAAERAAAARWRAGDDGVPESARCDLESVRAVEVPGDDRQAADQEEAFRFLRDRELVIEHLDADAFNPTVHDAVSAEEVASRLGWEEDAQRSVRALEGLCQQRRVVCFSRPKVRHGERGEIRLFCTPQHLERLSALLVEEVPEPVA